jgi:hypothetical protein
MIVSLNEVFNPQRGFVSLKIQSLLAFCKFPKRLVAREDTTNLLRDALWRFVVIIYTFGQDIEPIVYFSDDFLFFP